VYLQAIEWGFTGLFLLEYLARRLVAHQPQAYALSPLGIIDFLLIMPAVVALLIVQSHYLLAIRTLRLLRVFRIFKLGRFVGEGEFIVTALKPNRFKILVFLTAVFTLASVVGSLLYVVEGGQHGFTSIPKSIYWAIVTVTTVGYGDISPHTIAGQTLASLLMVLGYAIVAVPTGIVSAQMAQPSAPAFKQAAFCWLRGHRAPARSGLLLQSMKRAALNSSLILPRGNCAYSSRHAGRCARPGHAHQPSLPGRAIGPKLDYGGAFAQRPAHQRKPAVRYAARTQRRTVRASRCS
jgi:voltage-gated potassium channel